MSKEINEIKGLLSPYLDDELDEETRAQVTEELEKSEELREELESLKRISQSVSSLPQKDLPAGFISRLKSRQRREAGSAGAPLAWMPTPWRLAAFAATGILVCLVFFLGLRPQIDRNYGGMTSGFRWMFWFAPLWLLAMTPSADRLAPSRWGQAFGLSLLSFSALSASYPNWNPWTHPWIYRWLEYCGWQGF